MRSTLWLQVLASCLWLAATPPATAANLVDNGGFDGDASGWGVVSEAGRYQSQYRGDDATGDLGSGSLRVEHLGDVAAAYTGAVQCVAVADDTPYDVAARLRIPPGQTGSGSVKLVLIWFSSPGCAGFLNGETPILHSTPGGWVRRTATTLPPAGAASVRLNLEVEIEAAGTVLAADFDDVELDDGLDGGGGDPEPPHVSWISSPDLPGFEAQVRITPAGLAPIEGLAEPLCIPETICARGAVPGRPEIFVKVIGPRPNGYLWVQLIRFTPSRVEVWLRQVASGDVAYYDLDALPPGGGPLVGVEDREAFEP